MSETRPIALVLFAFVGFTAAQTREPPPAAPPANANVPETTTREQATTFRTGTNLVMVPVVVRDKQGRAVGGLHQEDFQVFDMGKPQVITRFTVEKSGMPVKTGQPIAPKGGEKAADAGVPASMPERFVAYLFDDIHTTAGDLMRVRDAAGRHMDTLAATDRAAIYTTSGRVTEEFTDDRDALHRTLVRLMPSPINSRNFTDCPDISYFMADLIINRNDPMALGAAIQETIVCMHMDASQTQGVDQIVRSAAYRALSTGDQETRVTLATLRDVLRRMSGMPGQRSVILASPGFFAREQTQEKTDLMDRAIRYNVIINSIDARGLYTDSTFDASRPGAATFEVGIVKNQYERQAASMDADVLAELALGTGGTFIQNTNDLEGGFHRVATAPEYIYVLGFSPQNLKLDGRYHALKVSLRDPGGLSALGRRGYYAPRHLNDAAEQASEEIREALFSKEELHELPVDLHTQFFKSSQQNARITVLMHVDLKNLHFRKTEARNSNDLTITAALFDRNGNYVVGNQKILEMRLRDETLDKRADTGFTVRSAFDVKPGTYLVRLVVRDAEGQQMSAANGAVEIP